MAAAFKLPSWVHSVVFGDGCGESHKPDKNGEVRCDACAAAVLNHTFHNPEPPEELKAPEAEWPAGAVEQVPQVRTIVADAPRPVQFVERPETTVEELEAEIARLRAEVAARGASPSEVPDVGGGGSQGPSRSAPGIAPAVRAHAEKLGVDLASVAGSGKNGAITKADVTAAAEKVEAPA